MLDPTDEQLSDLWHKAERTGLGYMSTYHRAREFARLLLATHAGAAAEPSDADMVNAAYCLHKYRQGTDNGIAFNRGARWMRAALTSAPAEPIQVDDAMAVAFHQALSDGAIGQHEVDEIKEGLRATLCNIGTPAEPRPTSSFLMRRIDSAAEVLSEVYAHVKLDEALTQKVGRTLSSLRGLQSVAVPAETPPAAGAIELQYREALECLDSVMRATSHVLVGLPPSEKEAKLRSVLSKAHDWCMAERSAIAAAGAIDARGQEAPSDDEQLVATLIHCSREVSSTAMTGYDLASVLSRAAERIQSIATSIPHTPSASPEEAPAAAGAAQAVADAQIIELRSTKAYAPGIFGYIDFARDVLALAATPAPEPSEAMLRELIALHELRDEIDHALQAGAESRDWAKQQKAVYQSRLEALVHNARAALKAAQPIERESGK